MHVTDNVQTCQNCNRLDKKCSGNLNVRDHRTTCKTNITMPNVQQRCQEVACLHDTSHVTDTVLICQDRNTLEKTSHGHLPKVVSQNHIATRTASCDRSRLADGRATSKTPTSKRGMLKCTTCVRKQTQACTCHRHLSMTLAATRLWRAACPGCPIPTPCQTSWNPHPVTPGHALMH